ncbi:MAG: glycosyl transferase [Deltaproteobacteria bacterium]|nr:MAG: glycosyl transferase [Deltaproteobacteria bacterium]
MRSRSFGYVQTAAPPLLIVIPAKDEATTIGTIIRRLQEDIDATILVIDDMSTDRTPEIARDAGARVLTLPIHLGAWGAIRTGLMYAKRHGFSTAITMDADGQHPVSQIPLLLDAAASNGADVVIGSYPSRGTRSKRVAWQIFRKITGLEIQDLTSGFRLYTGNAISILTEDLTALLDYQDVGVLALLNNRSLTLAETPVIMRPRVSGASRIFSSWLDVFRYMAVTWLLSITKINQD